MSSAGASVAAPTATRDRLIAAALEVVARDGLDRASVKAIAAHAGLAPGLMHYHFANKEAVLEAALVQASEAYVERLRQLRASTPPGQMTRAYMDSAAATIAEDKALFRVRLAFAARAISDPDLAARYRAINAAAVEESARLFAADRGDSAPTDADLARARVVKACYEGIMLSLLIDTSFPVDAAFDLFRRLLEVEPG